MDFKGYSVFRVVPNEWPSVDDSTLLEMRNAFADWILANEECMSDPDIDKANRLLKKWDKYITERGIPLVAI